MFTIGHSNVVVPPKDEPNSALFGDNFTVKGNLDDI